MELKALAWPLEDGRLGCASCVWDKAHKFIGLFLAVVKPVEVDGGEECQVCGQMYGRKEAEEGCARMLESVRQVDDGVLAYHSMV